MKNSFYILFLHFILYGCVATKPLPEPSYSSKTLFSEKELVELERNFIDANKEKLIGNYDEAVKLFLKCAVIDPSHDASFYELAKIYAESGNMHEALKYIKKAVAVNPKNEWYQLLHAEILEMSYNYKDAVKVYEQLINHYPEDISYYFDYAAMLIYSNQLNEALKAYDHIEKELGITEDISQQKKEIYLRLNKPQKAIGELEKLIESNPAEFKYYGQLSKLYFESKDTTKALKIFQKLMSLDPNNPNVHLLFADYYRYKGELDSSFSELRIAFVNPELLIDSKVRILLTYFVITKDSLSKRYALELAELLTKVHPEEAKAFAMYGDMLHTGKRKDEARQQYRTAIQLDKEKYLVWQQVLMIDSELNDYPALLKESEEALTLFPDQPMVYFFNGVAKIQSLLYEQAIEVIKSGLSITVDDSLLSAQLFANLGEAYHKMNKNESSDSAYDHSLNLDPNNIYVLNNFSYYLSLRNEKLDKAEQMSYRANLLEPNNSSFLDTYGWIKYKKGQFQDAQKWIEKAINNGGSKSPVINEHMGDVLFKLKDFDAAVKYWIKAKDIGSQSELINKKIADRQLYE